MDYRVALSLIDNEMSRLDYKSSDKVVEEIKDILTEVKRCGKCSKPNEFSVNYCSKCGFCLVGGAING